MSSVGSTTGTFPNSVGEAADALRELAEPAAASEKIKRLIERSAHRAGLSYWRAFDLWYGKARRLEQFEQDMLAEAITKKRSEAARNELHELRVRLARLESLLAQADQDFHQPSLDQLRTQTGGLGRMGRASRR